LSVSDVLKSGKRIYGEEGSTMGSLKEKAKTGLTVLNESIEKAMDKQDTGLWVRLEDAEKELDLQEARWDKIVSEAQQKCFKCSKEHLELKQKLRQFAIFLDDFYKRRRNQIVRPKFYEIFGELLKEEKAKPT
jgi:hypothetical protein